MEKMTVRELIAELECYPQSLEVVIEMNDTLTTVEEVAIDSESEKVIIR